MQARFVTLLLTDTGENSQSHTRHFDAAEKKKKKNLHTLDACGQISSPRLYRLRSVFLPFWVKITK